MNRYLRGSRWLAFAAIVGAVIAVPSAFAVDPEPVTVGSVEGAPMAARDVKLNVVVQLSDPSLAVAVKNAGGMSAGQQRAYLAQLKTKQDAASAQAAAFGATEVARLGKALDAVVFSTSSDRISDLESITGAVSVRPISDYALDLSETVPYIGAAAAHAAGIDGTGTRVAVIDSGIDYTHRAFGGAGTVAAYTQAYGTTTADPKNTTLDGLFPTAKVIGGYDFVGESWPTGALAPDPDPIDCGPSAVPAPCAGGHGSHVSDIIAGQTPGVPGVAPGAKLYAFKACSAVSTSCSGVALLEAVDAALDPNGDGSITDHADVINLSLGSNYGQQEDDLSQALEGAVIAGSVVAAAAGNAADRPYIVSSPSSAPDVISVAQTQVPSAKLYRIVAGSVTAGGSWQLWSAPPTNVSGQLVYDTTSAATRIGCTGATLPNNPWAPGSHAGQILLIDRGTCAISHKVANAAVAGAVAAVVANNVSQAPGDLPPDFSYGGGAVTIAGYTVTQADGNALKAAIPVVATIDPASAAPLVMNMVASSARGPGYSLNAIKPDIGAPGASVSAEAGTGTGTVAFGGTSGATPMIAGSAALMLDKSPGLTPFEVKTLLMNTAETNIGINPVAQPGVLAPITRIGGGEVRVKKALDSGTAAWDVEARTGSLSFGFQPTADTVLLHRQVAVHNYGGSAKTYSITPSFRYADDAASGAVSIDTPSSIDVPAGATKQFGVTLRIDPSKLPVWTLNGGQRGGDGYRLQGVEFDGYVTLNGGANDTVHVAWQVLPHRSAEVRIDRNAVGTGVGVVVNVRNQSTVLDGRVDVFSLTGESGVIKKKYLPQPGDNFAIVDLKSVGVRLNGSNIQFGIDTYGARAHPAYPAEFDVLIDANRDGNPDYIVFNRENGSFGSTGQTLVAVYNVATNAVSAYFYDDADLDSGNAILTAPLSAVGLTAGTKFNFAVEAYDNYFTGFLTDAIGDLASAPMTYTPNAPRFAGSLTPGDVPAGGRSKLTIMKPAGGDTTSPSQTGLLLLYRDAGYRGGPDPSRAEAEAFVIK